MPDVVGLAADAVAQARSSRSMMVMDCRLLGQANSLMRFRGAGRYTPYRSIEDSPRTASESLRGYP